MYIEGDVPYVTGNNCYGNNGFGFGNGWEGLIGLALVAGLFGGWGGFGFGGNRGGCGSACATQADLANGFAQNTLQRGIDDIILGQAQAINYNNQGFAGLNNALTSGFAGVNNAICTLGYQNQAGFNALSTQLAQCCCDTRAAIADVKYANERNTCSIIDANNANTRAILDFLTNEKIEGLRAENTALKGRISDDYQADRIISKLSPCPSPAYIVPNPNCCYNYGVTNFGSCGASVL